MNEKKPAIFSLGKEENHRSGDKRENGPLDLELDLDLDLDWKR